MKLILPDKVVVGTPSPLGVTVTPIDENRPLQVTFEVTQGDATLSSPEREGRKLIVMAKAGKASLTLKPTRPGPITVTASSGSSTVEATISVAAKPATGKDADSDPAAKYSMRLTLPNSIVVGTPSALVVHVAPENANTPPRVTFEVTSGDATLSLEQENGIPSSAASATRSDSAPLPQSGSGLSDQGVGATPTRSELADSATRITVPAEAGRAAVNLKPNKAAPVTITVSGPGSTLEATVSPTDPHSPTGPGPANSQAEEFRAHVLSSAAIALSLISLAAILFIRWHTLSKLKSSTQAGYSLQTKVNGLLDTAKTLDSSLREIQIDLDSGHSTQTSTSKSSSIPVTKQQPPAVSTPNANPAQRPAAGSHKNAKTAPRPQTVEAAEASALSTPPAPPAPMPPEAPLLPPTTDPTGDPLADYNRARAMSDPEGEDWFHRHYTCRGLSCKNLDEWKLDHSAKLVFEASSYGKFEALHDGTQTLVFPAFNVDYGPARGSLEGVFVYPSGPGDEVRLLSSAVVEGGGERWTLRKPGEFDHG